MQDRAMLADHLPENERVRAGLWAAPTGVGAANAAMPVFAGPAALLDAIRALTPEIVARAAEMEASGKIPEDLFRKIAATGILRAIRPRMVGGAEYALPDFLPVMEELAFADGSTAWSFVAASSASVVWSRMEPNVFLAAFEGDRDVLTRAGVTPRPGVTKVDGGLMVNGRWPLLSGSYPPDWVFIGGIVSEADGTPARTAEGQADLRFVMMPADKVKLLDTWYSLGLRSTESHDVEIENVFVPEAYTTSYSAAVRDGPRIGWLPLFLATGPFHLGVVLGIARAMVDELKAIARDKRPFLNPRILLKDDPLFQYRLGGIATRLSSARTFAYAETAKAWDLAADGKDVPSLYRMNFRAMQAFVHAECMAIANEVFGLAGSNVLYNDSSLQRRFRDMRAACQHVVANTDIYGQFGAMLVA